MKQLVFDRVEIESFGVFVNEHLDFASLGPGVHFVQGNNQYRKRMGSNGSGKTTIWNAVCWCLTGRTLAGLRTSDVVPWDTEETPKVTLRLRVDGEKHVIQRAGQTNGLWVDAMKVSQARIDELVGLSYTTLPHTIVLGQGQPLFFDLDPRNKMEVLSDALKLDRWEERSKRAGLKHRKLELSITALDTEIKGLERSSDDNEATLADLKIKSRDWESERNARDADRDKQIKIIEKALERAEIEWGQHDLKYDSAETELRAALKEKEKAQRVLEAAAVRVGELNGQVRVMSSDYDRKKAELDAMEEGTDCPVCKRAMKGPEFDKHFRATRARLKQLDVSITAEEALARSMTTARDAAQKLVDKYSAQCATFRTKSNDAIDARSRADDRRQELKAGLAAAKKASKTDNDQENPYSALAQRTREQIKALGTTIKEATTLLNEASRKATRVKYWVQGFKQVRLYLLEEVLDELEAVTATLLPAIGLEDWAVRFDMEKELKSGDTRPGLQVTIAQPGIKQEAIKWEAWSSGEGQRLRLIGAIALSEVLLRRTGVTCDLLVLDEPTRHMSPQGVRETIDFILERGRNAQIMYTDHAAISTTRFASTVTVTRVDKCSAEIEQERATAA